MTRDFKILTTFWFLTGLTLLLLNDFVFKGLYSNWLTGKLSDFAGLFIFPLFWTVLLPRHKSKVFWLTGLFFIFWKSPFSQTFIDTWNNLGLLTISRVVDYTDFVALTVLPFAFYIETIKEKIRAIRLTPYIPLTLSAFAFIATSEGGPQPEVYYFDIYFIDKPQDRIVSIIDSEWSEDCYESKNSNLPQHKYCRIFIKNDTVRFFDIDVNETKNGKTMVKLNKVKYEVEVLGQEDGEKLDDNLKAELKRIFEREIIEKLKNAP
ncbi:MAG TPA: hypothetical protein EYN89_04195 [Flavobacteriales bacterium]|nr:hypothetical protein [Flavobacteriales bacterium]